MPKIQSFINQRLIPFFRTFDNFLNPKSLHILHNLHMRAVGLADIEK